MSDAQERLMQAQANLARRQALWEIPKAVATVLAAIAVFCGFVLAAASWIHPSAPPPQQITVHLDSPILIAPANR